MIASRRILLRMRNVSDKSCRENQNTYFMFNNVFPKSCCLGNNAEKCGTARQNMSYLLLLHGNNGYSKALLCYVTRALPVLCRILTVGLTAVFKTVRLSQMSSFHPLTLNRYILTYCLPLYPFPSKQSLPCKTNLAVLYHPNNIWWTIRIINLIIKLKVKFTLEQAMKVQRGSRGIALLFI
jgi:hypothetical protein